MKMSSLKLYDLTTKWKRERIKKALNTLGHKDPEINDTDVMIKKLTEVKLRYSYNKMYDKLKSKLRLSGIGMHICTVLSGDRRKFSKTSIYLDGITAEEAIIGEMIADAYALKK